MKKQLLTLLLTACTVPAIIEEIQPEEQDGQKKTQITEAKAQVVRFKKCAKCR